MIPVVVITTAIGIIAGLTSIIHNIIQIKHAKSQDALECASAIKIQRAFRRHRTAKFSYGALKFEFTTENVPTFHQVEAIPPVEQEPLPQPSAPPVQPDKKKWFFNLF